MSASRGFGSNRDLSDAFQEFLTACAKTALTLGLLCTVVSAALLVFTCFRVNDPNAHASIADAAANSKIFGKILLAGILGVTAGSTFLFWGEEVLGVLQLLGAAALFFAPLYLPSALGGASNDATKVAFGELQSAGVVFGVLAVLVLAAEIVSHVRSRVAHGSKSDQLKYGKGIKEEADRQNVFMGKCWQLPYCRRFVRLRCPIYHSKRTCWKEQVGCMCEEKVIQDAMENRPIPKDELLAAKLIPHNHKLTFEQKRDRCKQCVIYNEHQRHKYKLAMPITLGVMILLFALTHSLLYGETTFLTEKINRVVQVGTLGALGQYQPPPFFVEMLLFVFFVVVLTYAMKVLEFLIFKLKV